MEERIEYLANRGALCFPPCRSDVAVVGNAFDLILIQSSTDPTVVTCSDTLFSFALNPVLCNGTQATQAVLEIAQVHGEPIQFPILNQKILPAPAASGEQPHGKLYMEDRCSHRPVPDEDNCNSSSSSSSQENSHHDARSLARLASFLKVGRNSARYLLLSSDGMTLAIAPTNIFLWSDRDRIMVVDVDGTITRSNIRGVVDTILTEQYTYCHDGVCEFLSSLMASSSILSSNMNIRLLYLTSRPIGIANTTRKFLSQLRQCDTHQLPEGPLIGHTGTLPQVLMMELVYRSIHEFKAATLLQHVVQPFFEQGVDKREIFLAGFGNTLMDMQAYHMAGMDVEHIYLIDKQSKIYCLDDQAKKKKLDFVTVHDNDNKPKPRHEYLQMRGTHFTGYLDERLLAHVLDR
jgi:hypothetical protein